MADDAIDYMTRMHQIQPDKPIFIKYAPGATHAPHHPTKEWVDKISKMKLFDEGWNKVRERIFENQKRLGVVPQDAKLPPWPKDVLKEWDTLSAEEQKLFIRQVEVFAAYAAYSDHEIGRVVQAFENLGKLDNTLIIYINGDNGTSAEGGPMGTPNEVAWFNGVNDLPAEVQMKFYDVWGTEQTYNHMSAGWSWTFDTPFRWFKQNASQLGGVNQNMVVSWPARIKDKGALREQFVHVIDVVPTILEAAGIRAPEIVDGIKQKPIEGTSFAYTFDANNAKAPSRHKTQYFEMMGQWALYDDGWFLSTKVNRAPWEAFGPANPDPLNKQVLELFNLNVDFNQTTDLAAKNPQKVKELKDKFIAEAKKYQVFPMDASVAARIVAPRPNITAGRSEFVYTRPMVGLPQGDSPLLLNTSYTITADIEVPQGGAEGMILTSGGRFAGYGFYLLQGKPVFLWNMVDLRAHQVGGRRRADAGPAHGRVRFQVRRDRCRYARVQQLQRPRPARHRHAEGGRQGGRHEADAENAADDPAVGRELRYRLRHADRRQRRRLQATVRADRQTQQADDQGGPPATVASRHQETSDSDAGKGEERLIPPSGEKRADRTGLRATFPVYLTACAPTTPPITARSCAIPTATRSRRFVTGGSSRRRKRNPDQRSVRRSSTSEGGSDIRVLALRWLARESTNSGRLADVRRIISHAAEPRVLSFQVSKYRPQPGTDRKFSTCRR